MREPRLFLDRDLASGESLALRGDSYHYLARVLRVKPGAGMTVFNGRGGEHAATVEAIDRACASVRIGEHRDIERESRLRIVLAQGVGRGERTDYAIQKAVELGVAGIAPLLTRRGVVRLEAARATRRLEHWRGVVIGACQQCGRNRLPDLHPLARIEEWLAQRPLDGLGIVLDAKAEATLGEIEHRGESITLLVGPEGGLTDEEVDAACARGFRRVRLGPRVLRTETAGIAAIAACQALWGDLAGRR